MFVKCIYTENADVLTKGKLYELLFQKHGLVSVIDDVGKRTSWSGSRFEEVNEKEEENMDKNKYDAALKLVLEEHLKWVNNNSKGTRLNLNYENLRGASLYLPDLGGVDLRKTYLIDAKMEGADFGDKALVNKNWVEKMKELEANPLDSNVITKMGEERKDLIGQINKQYSKDISY